jgi:hypothetical protein
MIFSQLGPGHHLNFLLLLTKDSNKYFWDLLKLIATRYFLKKEGGTLTLHSTEKHSAITDKGPVAIAVSNPLLQQSQQKK